MPVIHSGSFGKYSVSGTSRRLCVPLRLLVEREHRIEKHLFLRGRNVSGPAPAPNPRHARPSTPGSARRLSSWDRPGRAASGQMISLSAQVLDEVSSRYNAMVLSRCVLFPFHFLRDGALHDGDADRRSPFACVHSLLCRWPDR